MGSVFQSSIVNRQSSIVNSRGFTLAELLIGVAVLVLAITALMGAFLGQGILNEHARNLGSAMNDANRVMEQLRLRNTNTPSLCATDGTDLSSDDSDTTAPTANIPPGFASWDLWLADTSTSGGGGKSIQPTPSVNELVIVTCQNQGGTVTCTAADDPIRVTVAVCWRHRGRILGECRPTGGVGPGLEAWEAVVVPNDDSNVIQSPAMLSTIMTCRQ